jgi:threonylcarbamoyladenosine tRNA methylthiotransferase MtaB
LVPSTKLTVKTFSVQTLGCKVNQYEGEQLATLLRSRGLVPAQSSEQADLRIVHTCSVTMQAASKSRQTVRRAVRLPVLESRVLQDAAHLAFDVKAEPSASITGVRPKVVVTGCWATSDRETAEELPGVDAVITHRQDVAAELDRLLSRWGRETALEINRESSSEPRADDGWISRAAGAPAERITPVIKATAHVPVNRNLFEERPVFPGSSSFASLPVLGQHQAGRQRAFLKVQDGCDAHCTYCIIPKLRPNLWSKPIDMAVDEAKSLVVAGHVEIVLTGIFLGAFGHATALRKRHSAGGKSIGDLVEALCVRVPGLRRLRLSSLEPGDLTTELIDVLKSFEQVVPHFHLPLQSGSDRLLRRMNRQYKRGDYFEMLDRVQAGFDRPALTTDVIVGFPGESDDEFDRTVEVVDRARFIHVHAFSFSPRPGTAAARWGDEFVHGPVVNDRILRLTQLADAHSFQFRQRFLGETVELLVEAGDGNHGRCERYFDVTIPDAAVRTGDFVRARVVSVTRDETLGEVVR